MSSDFSGSMFTKYMMAMATLSRWERLKIRLGLKVSIGYFIKPGWKEPIEFYAFWCPIHGIVANHPHGHYHKLTCPKCFEDICDRPQALSIDKERKYR